MKENREKVLRVSPPPMRTATPSSPRISMLSTCCAIANNVSGTQKMEVMMANMVNVRVERLKHSSLLLRPLTGLKMWSSPCCSSRPCTVSAASSLSCSLAIMLDNPSERSSANVNVKRLSCVRTATRTLYRSSGRKCNSVVRAVDLDVQDDRDKGELDHAPLAGPVKEFENVTAALASKP